MAFKQASGQIFACKDTAGVHAAPDEKIFPLQNAADRGEKARHSVDGEHPY